MVNAARTAVSWPETHRVILSKFPPISLFDDIADPHDWDALVAAESKTNPRIFDDIGDLSRVPVVKRLAGDGASWVMAAFTHVSPDRQSRFSDGSYGVYYAARSLETALHEHAFHMGRFYYRTAEPAGWLSETRQLIGAIDAALLDIRGGGFDDVLNPDPEQYAAAQAFAANARQNDENGIVYPSCRDPGGMCVAAFWPNVVIPPKQGDHYRYHWNGTCIDYVQQLTGSRQTYTLDP